MKFLELDPDVLCKISSYLGGSLRKFSQVSKKCQEISREVQDNFEIYNDDKLYFDILSLADYKILDKFEYITEDSRIKIDNENIDIKLGNNYKIIKYNNLILIINIYRVKAIIYIIWRTQLYKICLEDKLNIIFFVQEYVYFLTEFKIYKFKWNFKKEKLINTCEKLEKIYIDKYIFFNIEYITLIYNKYDNYYSSIDTNFFDVLYAPIKEDGETDERLEEFIESLEHSYLAKIAKKKITFD